MDPHDNGPLIQPGLARLGSPLARRARARARRHRRRRFVARQGAHPLPPRHQPRQRPPRRRGGRRPTHAARRFLVGRVGQSASGGRVEGLVGMPHYVAPEAVARRRRRGAARLARERSQERRQSWGRRGNCVFLENL